MKSYLTDDKIARFKEFYDYLKKKKPSTATNYIYVLNKLPQSLLDSLNTKQDLYKVREFINENLGSDFDWNKNYRNLYFALKKYLIFKGKKEITEYLEKPEVYKQPDLSNKYMSWTEALQKLDVLRYMGVRRKGQGLKKGWDTMRKPSEHDYVQGLFMLVTGARIYETLSVMPSSIDWDKRQCTVVKKGKLGATRIVLMNNLLIEKLKQYINDMKLQDDKLLFDYHYKKIRPPDVITNVEGVKDYIYRRKTNHTRNMMRKAKFSPHKLRHSLAMHLYDDKGLKLEDIQMVLGHTSIGTTQIYAKSSMKKVQEKYEEAMRE